MGNASSRTNDQLIDQFVERRRVLTRNVERAFRFVDRASFLPPIQQENAYSEIPIRLITEKGGVLHPGPLHLSAPGVYVTVATELEIEKGHSFLNIGSGTGYFSTVIGCLLGGTGVNHGIEVYPNLIQYAEKRIEEWMDTPMANSIGWARPQFAVANVYNEQFLEAHANMYDRIFLSFLIPYRTAGRRVLSRIVRMLKVGGVLVAPCNGHLCRYVRTGEDTCVRHILDSMSFSLAIEIDPFVPQPPVTVFDTVPSLSELAREAVCRHIRKEFYTPALQLVAMSCLVRKGSVNRREIRRLTPGAFTEAVFDEQLHAMLTSQPNDVQDGTGNTASENNQPSEERSMLITDSGEPVGPVIDIQMHPAGNDDDEQVVEADNGLARRERELQMRRIRQWQQRRGVPVDDPLHMPIVSQARSDSDRRAPGDLSEDEAIESGEDELEEERRLSRWLSENQDSNDEEETAQAAEGAEESEDSLTPAETASPHPSVQSPPPVASSHSVTRTARNPWDYLPPLERRPVFPPQEFIPGTRIPAGSEMIVSGYNPLLSNRAAPSARAYVQISYRGSSPDTHPSSRTLERMGDMPRTQNDPNSVVEAAEIGRLNQRSRIRQGASERPSQVVRESMRLATQNKRRDLRSKRNLSMQKAYEKSQKCVQNLPVPNSLKAYISRMHKPTPPN